MAKSKKKQTPEKDKKGGSLWRKPITLDSLEDKDPLAALYQGKQASSKSIETGKSTQKQEAKIAKPSVKPKKNVEKSKVTTKPKIIESKKPATSPEKNKRVGDSNRKFTEDELKDLLRIKNESFQFTDIREILRGKSFDIYAYLCFLSGNSGVCKIKHLDLMKTLDISRPTLFKQSDWLRQLFLIDKSSVPGDHLGTSYNVYRIEEVLPISDALLEQLQSHIDTFLENKDA